MARQRLFLAAAFGIALALPMLAQQNDQTFTERIDVVRYLVTIRVVDAAGDAITDLEPTDFTATMNGTDLPVESATWFGDEPGPDASLETSPEASPNKAAPPPPPPPKRNRLVVIYVQTHFARASQRLEGQMKFNAAVADKLVDIFSPDDLVAVVSHDSHMKLQQDFTSDREAILRAVRDAIFVRRVPLAEPPARGPSLARRLSEREMLDAADGQAALLVLSRALTRIPGEKIVIIAGWGLGDFRGTHVAMSSDWNEAIALLQSEDIPVITLSTGMEGGQLSIGMAATSKQTGGFFAGTQSFAGQALRRVEGALAGYYELSLRGDMLDPGRYPIEISVNRRNAVVMMSPNVVVTGQLAEREYSLEDPIREIPEPPSERARAKFIEAMRFILAGETEAARPLLDEVIRIEPRYAEAWYERGMIAAGLDERTSAAADFRRYLELEPRGRYAATVREMLRALPRK